MTCGGGESARPVHLERKLDPQEEAEEAEEERLARIGGFTSEG